MSLKWEFMFESARNGYVYHFARIPAFGEDWMCEIITLTDAKRIAEEMGPDDSILGWDPRDDRKTKKNLSNA